MTAPEKARKMAAPGTMRALDELRSYVRGQMLMNAPRLNLFVVAAAAASGQTCEAIRGVERSRRLSRARQAAMLLARQRTSASLTEIGRAFGGRDHTTVLHALRADWEEPDRAAMLDRVSDALVWLGAKEAA